MAWVLYLSCVSIHITRPFPRYRANKQWKVVFPALLPLTYVPALLERTKALFLVLFQPYVTSLIESLSSGGASAGSALKQLKEKIVEERWDEVWDRCFRSCEGVR